MGEAKERLAELEPVEITVLLSNLFEVLAQIENKLGNHLLEAVAVPEEETKLGQIGADVANITIRLQRINEELRRI